MLFGSVEPVVFVHLSRALAIAYVLACVVCFLRRKWVKVFFYVVGCTLFSINLFVWLVFHKVFSPQLFVLVGETNWREASEFVTTFLLRGRGLVCLLIVAVVVTIIALAERARQRLQELWKRHGGHTVACAILVCVAFGMCHFDIFYKIGKSKTLEDIDVGNRFPYDNITATLMAIHDVKAIAHEMQTAINVARQVRPGVVADRDSLHVALVIGESYIKAHAQIYGYYLPNTPHLMCEKKNGNLFVFTNVVAPYNQTSYVMKNLMCCNSLADGVAWYRSPFFPPPVLSGLALLSTTGTTSETPMCCTSGISPWTRFSLTNNCATSLTIWLPPRALSTMTSSFQILKTAGKRKTESMCLTSSISGGSTSTLQHAIRIIAFRGSQPTTYAAMHLT